jgi:hypothetical protein
MRRREFITMLGGVGAAAATFWPHPLAAQQAGRIYRIGSYALGSKRVAGRRSGAGMGLCVGMAAAGCGLRRTILYSVASNLCTAPNDIHRRNFRAGNIDRSY